MCVLSPVLAAGLCFLPQHRHGTALLNDERPATPEAKGSRAFFEKVFGSGRVRRPRLHRGGSINLVRLREGPR